MNGASESSINYLGMGEDSIRREHATPGLEYFRRTKDQMERSSVETI